MAQFQNFKCMEEFNGKDVFLYGVATRKLLGIIPVIAHSQYGSKIDKVISLNINVKGFAGLSDCVSRFFLIPQAVHYGVSRISSMARLRKYAKKHPIAVIIMSDRHDDYNKIINELGNCVDLIVYYAELLPVLRLVDVEKMEAVSPEYRVGCMKEEAELLKRAEHFRVYRNAMDLFINTKMMTNIAALPKTGNTTLEESLYLSKNKNGFLLHGISGCRQDILDYFHNNMGKFKWMAGVREPLSLIISDAFELWSNYTVPWIPDIPEYAYGGDCFNPNYFIHELINFYDKTAKQDERKTFFDFMLETKMYVFDVLNFFDKEYKDILGLDVYSKPFDPVKGYEIIENNGTSLFVYRLENMNSIEKEIGEFLEIDDFKLIKGNMSDNKWYKDYYEQFKKHDFRITRADFDKLYDSKYMKHFYSAEEIAKYRDKWNFAVVEDESQL